jgi:RNA polymerase sigma-32 factor
METQKDPDLSQGEPLEADPEEELPIEPAGQKGGAALIRPSTLQLYLSQVSRFPLLTPEEEYELALRYYEKGDREAAYTLVTSNLRIVVKTALEFQRTWMHNLLDLIQEGNLGLMQAVKKFNPYKGIRLTSYASFWIKAYILKFILDNWRLVKIGKTQAERKLFYNLYKEKERLHQLGYDPGPKLIADNLQVSESDVIQMDQRLGSWEISLEKPLREDSSFTPKDLLPAHAQSVDEVLGDEELRRMVREKLQSFRETLSARDQDIFDNRLMAETPLTLKELGDRYGITKERTRQLESRLLTRIKHHLAKEIPDAEVIIPDLLSRLPI